MTVVSLKAHITTSGQLEVELPYDLPSGDARVTLEVPLRSEKAKARLSDGPPYPSLRGIWAGKLPDADIEADLAEMNRQWRKSLDLSE